MTTYRILRTDPWAEKEKLLPTSYTDLRRAEDIERRLNRSYSDNYEYELVVMEDPVPAH